MRLDRLILKNFRAYKKRTVIEFSDLTTFVGRNDIGKSTILEALEIFFNSDLVKCERGDLSIHSDSPQSPIDPPRANFSGKMRNFLSSKSIRKAIQADCGLGVPGMGFLTKDNLRIAYKRCADFAY